MHRRTFARLAATAAAATTLPRWAWSGALRQRDLFPLGVASGSPAADGFVLWTRLLDGPVPGTVSFDTPRVALPAALTVRWEVARDESFRQLVQSGQASARAELGHAVHVEVTGLQPDRWYFYRFMHGDAVTPTARTRTLPAADAMVDRLRLAFVSCQRWEQGHYAGYRHMLAENLDLVLFLGDYIYEFAMPTTPKPYVLARTHSLPLAGTLADFRDRYALYKTDPHLQAAHRACPWLVSWDDHELQDDYAGTSGFGDPADFLARRAAAYQAFYENMPLRASVLAGGTPGLHPGDELKIYGRHAYGRLADLHMLDTRQYRANQACRQPGAKKAGAVSPQDCPELLDPKRSMLGAQQERWIGEGLARDAADGARWSVLAQQTIFARRNYKQLPAERYHSSTWDGYPAGRQRLLDAVRQAAPRNTVFLGGDIHQNYTSRVLADFSRPDAPVIGSEFCGTSIASASLVKPTSAQAIADVNPHILMARSDQRGYGVAEVTPTRWTTTLRVLDDVLRPDSGVATQAQFVVEDRRPGPQRTI